MKIVLTFVILLATIFEVIASDSLRIFIQGMMRGEKYKIYYNHQYLRKVKCRNEKCSEYLSLSIDPSISKGKILPIEIYRKGFMGFVYRNTFFSVTYNPEFKFLIIFRNQRLKKRYALEPLWRDEKLKYD